MDSRKESEPQTNTLKAEDLKAPKQLDLKNSKRLIELTDKVLELQLKLKEVNSNLDHEVREKQRIIEQNAELTGELSEVRRALKDMQLLFFRNVQHATEQLTRNQEQRSTQFSDLTSENKELESRIRDLNIRLKEALANQTNPAETEEKFRKLRQQLEVSEDTVTTLRRENTSLAMDCKELERKIIEFRSSRTEEQSEKSVVAQDRSEMLNMLREQLAAAQESRTKAQEECIKLKSEKMSAELMVTKKEEIIHDLREANFKEKENSFRHLNEKKLLEMEIENRRRSATVSTGQAVAEQQEVIVGLQRQYAMSQEMDIKLKEECNRIRREKEAVELIVGKKDEMIADLREQLFHEKQQVLQVLSEKKMVEVDVEYWKSRYRRESEQQQQQQNLFQCSPTQQQQQYLQLQLQQQQQLTSSFNNGNSSNDVMFQNLSSKVASLELLLNRSQGFNSTNNYDNNNDNYDNINNSGSKIPQNISPSAPNFNNNINYSTSLKSPNKERRQQGVGGFSNNNDNNNYNNSNEYGGDLQSFKPSLDGNTNNFNPTNVPNPNSILRKGSSIGNSYNANTNTNANVPNNSYNPVNVGPGSNVMGGRRPIPVGGGRVGGRGGRGFVRMVSVSNNNVNNANNISNNNERVYGDFSNQASRVASRVVSVVSTPAPRSPVEFQKHPRPSDEINHKSLASMVTKALLASESVDQTQNEEDDRRSKDAVAHPNGSSSKTATTTTATDTSLSLQLLQVNNDPGPRSSRSSQDKKKLNNRSRSAEDDERSVRSERTDRSRSSRRRHKRHSGRSGSSKERDANRSHSHNNNNNTEGDESTGVVNKAPMLSGFRGVSVAAMAFQKQLPVTLDAKLPVITVASLAAAKQAGTLSELSDAYEAAAAAANEFKNKVKEEIVSWTAKFVEEHGRDPEVSDRPPELIASYRQAVKKASKLEAKMQEISAAKS